MTAAPSLSPLDVASGLVFGDQAGAAGLTPPRGVGPRAALEEAVLRGLTRPPCLVSFSGGRDSAAVLAVAAHVARREGLDDPVPATNRFAGAPATDEAEWQEQIVRHLGLQDWVRIELTDELDCVGPVAQEILLRDGLLWPFNAHFHVPILRRAERGSVLTGAGGDEALSASQWDRTRAVLSGAARPRARDVLRVGLALSPRRVRAAVLRRRIPKDAFPWLRADARAQVERAAAAEAAAEPIGWRARLGWMRRLRHMELAERSLDVLASAEGASVEHPLADRSVWAELTALPRGHRFRDRSQAMRLVVGDLLPEHVLTRSTKAAFDEAFWTSHARDFAASWDGEHVDDEVVDPVALEREWRSSEPNPRSYLLAQSVWLARARSEGRRELEQPGDGLVERPPVAGTTELPAR